MYVSRGRAWSDEGILKYDFFGRKVIYMNLLSTRALNVAPSPTLAVDAKAKAMKAQGIDVIGFGAGEPDFDTPEHIRRAGIEAIENGHTRYTPASGTLELKKAVCSRIMKDYGIEYDPSQIIVSCGAKHSLFNAFMALCNDGDEVIIPAPYWVSYPDQVKMAGGVPVVVNTMDTGFKLTTDSLKGAITPRTKVLVLNSPSNPTGAVYTRGELEAIAEVITDNDLFVISDDIYEKLLYTDREFVSIVQVSDEIRKRTLLVNGVSKSYAMTGWRIGYAAGDKALISAMNNIQSHSTSNPCSISMKAAVAALEGPDAPVMEMIKEFRKRGEYMYERFAAMPGIEAQRPAGAFYVFPKVSSYFGKSIAGVKIENSSAFSELMLSEGHIAIVAGDGFGADEYVRLSYAMSMENIKEGLDRFEKVLSQIK